MKGNTKFIAAFCRQELEPRQRGRTLLHRPKMQQNHVLMSWTDESICINDELDWFLFLYFLYSAWCELNFWLYFCLPAAHHFLRYCSSKRRDGLEDTRGNDHGGNSRGVEPNGVKCDRDGRRRTKTWTRAHKETMEMDAMLTTTFDRTWFLICSLFPICCAMWQTVRQ